MCSEGNWTELILWFMELNIYCNSKVMPKHCKHFLCPTSAGDDKLWNIGVWHLSRFFLIYIQLLHHCFSLYTSGKNPYNVHSNNAIFCNLIKRFYFHAVCIFFSNFNNFFELNQDIQLRGTGAVCIPRQITELTKNGRGMPSDFMEFNVTWDSRLCMTHFE